MDWGRGYSLVHNIIEGEERDPQEATCAAGFTLSYG